MKAGNCVHFNGIQRECCAVGVRYYDLGDGTRPGMALRLPCLPMIDNRGETRNPCEKFRARTEEEAAALKAELDAAEFSIAAGVSPCCQAPTIDTRTGNQTGWIVCSKCRKWVMHLLGESLHEAP